MEETANSGEDTIQILLLPIGKLHFSQRSFAPTVVCAAENKNRMDLLGSEEALVS
jgi:hypothetical protein